MVVLLGTGIAAGHEIAARDRSSHEYADEFPQSIPGSRTDVSYQDAFRHHNIQLPVGVASLEYQALSSLDGYPTFADFVMPCTEKEYFVQSNAIVEVANEWDLPSAEDLYYFADDHGLSGEGTRDYWYDRPAGEAGTVQVLIAESSTCHAYLTAVDHY